MIESQVQIKLTEERNEYISVQKALIKQQQEAEKLLNQQSLRLMSMVKGASWNDAHEAMKSSNGDIGRAETTLRVKYQIGLSLINPGSKNMQC